MKPGTVPLTRKIRLFIDHPDTDERKKILDKLYHWQHMCFRSANYIFTHHFLQDQVGELFYINEGIKLKLGSIEKDADGVLATSRENTTYQLLSMHFKGQLPSDIYTGLNRMLVTHYNREREHYWKGQKSIPNYRRDMPMPIKSRSIKNMEWIEDGRNIKFTLFKQPFRTCLGKYKDDKRKLLQRIMEGSLHLCDSSIQLQKGKIFLLATVEMEVAAIQLQKDIIAEVSLSIECPMLVAIGQYKYSIGNKEEFLYRRLAIQAAMKRAQSAAGYNRSGHGKKRKFKAVSKYRNIEKNYVDYKLHVYSRRLVDLCIKHQAATILLVQQQEKEQEAKENDFLLRNWNISGLKEKIKYKAAKMGIEVIEE